MIWIVISLEIDRYSVTDDGVSSSSCYFIRTALCTDFTGFNCCFSFLTEHFQECLLPPSDDFHSVNLFTDKPDLNG